jgi:hypothetical protein
MREAEFWLLLSLVAEDGPVEDALEEEGMPPSMLWGIAIESPVPGFISLVGQSEGKAKGKAYKR